MKTGYGMWHVGLSGNNNFKHSSRIDSRTRSVPALNRYAYKKNEYLSHGIYIQYEHMHIFTKFKK